MLSNIFKSLDNTEKSLFIFYSFLFVCSVYLLYFGLYNLKPQTTILGISVVNISIYLILSLGIKKTKIKNKKWNIVIVTSKWIGILLAIIYIFYDLI